MQSPHLPLNQLTGAAVLWCLLFLLVPDLWGPAPALVTAQTDGASACWVSGDRIRFQPLSAGAPRSFIFSERSPEILYASTSQPLPRIIVQVIDSRGKLDPLIDTGFVNVSLVGRSGVLRGDTTVAIYHGEAHFTNLALEREGQVRLQFGATGPPGLAFSNRPPLVTGLLSVSSRPADSAWALRFSPTKSFIKYGATPTTRATDAPPVVAFTPGVPFPPIRLNLLTSAYRVFTTRTLGNNFTITVAFGRSETPIRLLPIFNGVAVASGGVAVFDNLIVGTKDDPLPVTDLPGLNFSLVMGSSTSSIFSPWTISDPLRAQANEEWSNIGFESEVTSFIFTEGQEMTMSADDAFPPFRISLRDTMMRLSPPTTGLIITAACERAELQNNVVGVVNGVATFDNLQFRGIFHQDVRPYALTFTAGSQAIGGKRSVAGKRLNTGIILVKVGFDRAYSMRFRREVAQSFVNAQEQSAQVALHQVLPPILVELLNSNNQIDTTNASATALFVTATVEGSDLGVPGNRITAKFRSGVATFSNIKFVRTDGVTPARLTFVAGPPNASMAVTGVSLVTGFISITPSGLGNFDMRFQPYGASHIAAPNTPLFATVGVPFPPIVIELITSARIADRTNNDVGITAEATGGATLSNSFIRVTNGVAVFDRLMFVSDLPGTFTITFTAGKEGNTAVAGKTLRTGPVSVVAASTPNFRIRFRSNDSYIRFEGHVMPIVLATEQSRERIPPITVELVSSTYTTSTQDSAEGGSNTNNNIAISDMLVAVIETGGEILEGSTTRPFIRGAATFDDLVITNAFDPIITVCARAVALGLSSSAARLSEAEGHCVSSGNLIATPSPARDSLGALVVLNAEQAHPRVVTLTRGIERAVVYPSEPIKVALQITDALGQFRRYGNSNASGTSSGVALPPRNLDSSIYVQADSSVALGSPTSVPVDPVDGIAYFDNLRFVGDIPAGASPIITFTAYFSVDGGSTRVPTIGTGLLTVLGIAAQSAGVDVVAELNFQFTKFQVEGWKERVARRLNIEVQRIAVRRLWHGTSAKPPAPGVALALDDNRKVEWRGTRLTFRFVEPLRTSANTKSAAELADFFVSLTPGCDTSDIFLRRAYLLANDETCDWFVADDQISGARQCVQTRGKEGYCDCHVPMFEAIGARCVGLPQIADLCVNTLTPDAQCRQSSIRDICQLLEYPDTPRTAVAASGAFLFLFFPPLVYLRHSGFFHKLNRPSARKGRLTTLEFVSRDQTDML